MPSPSWTGYYDNLVRGASHTVGYPLYRILALFVIPPAILQLIYWEAPDSIKSSTPSWYDAIFIIFQLLGAVFVLLSLSMDNTSTAAQVERLGVILMGAVGFAYFLAAWEYVGPRPPLTVASWLQLGFSFFCLIRWVQLNKELSRWENKVRREDPDVG